MKTINLRDFYYYYTMDEFVDVSDEVAAELFADRKYSSAHKRRMRRNKVLSLDVNDGTEVSASLFYTDNPETIFDMLEQHCHLCCALNSLPEIQGRRIDAHFLLGLSRKEIATTEGVSESSVNESISRGLRAMKLFLEKHKSRPVKCPQSDLISEG